MKTSSSNPLGPNHFFFSIKPKQVLLLYKMSSGSQACFIKYEHTRFEAAVPCSDDSAFGD